MVGTTIPESWIYNNNQELLSIAFDSDEEEEHNIKDANINPSIRTDNADRCFAHTAFMIIKFMVLFMITELCRLNNSCAQIHSKIMRCFRPIFRRIRYGSNVSHVLWLVVLLVVLAMAIISRIFIELILRPILQMVLLIDEIMSTSHE